jgi:hypothetical protein
MVTYQLSAENLERLKQVSPGSYERMKGGIGKMDISSWTKSSGLFLKAEDIKKNPQGVFVITDEGQMVKSEKFGTEQFHLSGEFAGEEKTLTLSKTNGRTVEKALGTDTKKWIGHSLSFDLYRVKTSDGKMVDAINVALVK